MIANLENPWAAGWSEGHQPPKDQTVAEWCAENVYLPNSPIGAKYQAGGHSDDILNDLQDPDIYESATVGHTGMGKSAIIECACCYIVAQAPGPALILGQTDKTVQDWSESRGRKAMEMCEPVARLMPTGKDRHKTKKLSIMFHHMEMFLGGANLTNTQEKSMRYTIGDEPWAWEHGIIGEFLKRHHDRWNRKNLLLAQGGTEDDDWHIHTKNGLGFDRAFHCQACNQAQIFKWKQVKFESLKNGNDEWDWPLIEPTVHYECENPECGETFEDTARGRRRLTEKSFYECRHNSHVRGRVTRYIPAMANPRIQLFSLVREWLESETAWKNGDKTPRRQFIQKRLAQFWVEKPDVPILRVDEDPYKMDEYSAGQKWAKEHFRFLTIDLQKGHFWGRIRAWGIGGESRGLWEGKITAWENIRALQDKYEIPNRCVFVDSRYMPEEVAKARVKYRGGDSKFLWNMIMGEDSKGYSVQVGTKGKKMLRTYSSLMRSRSQAGIMYEFFKFSNLRAKDMLASLMAGNGSYYGVETDHSPDYAKQMTSETKRLFGKEWRWVQIKDHLPNHLWDCEVMQIVAACVFRCLGGLVEDD